MKRASKEVYENEQPTDLRFGTVVSAKPLKVQVTNLFTIPESMLIVPQHLTDYEIEISLKSDYGWITQDTQGGSPLSPTLTAHNHKHDIIQSKKKVFIHNALKAGDKVALIRKHGGQSFFILDRI
jgi:hypothetical protein